MTMDPISEALNKELLATLLAACPFEQAMQSLFSALEKFVPASFMVCYSVSHRSAHATTLAYYGDPTVMPTLEATKIHLLTHDDRIDHAYDKEKSIFWLNDYRKNSVIRKNLESLFPRNFSVMCMTINDTPGSHFIIAFVANTPHGFEEEHVKVLQSVYPMFQYLVDQFFPTHVELPQGLVMPLERAETSLKIIRQCKGMRQAVQRAEAVAPTDVTVLIEGETGVGKDLLARSLHHLSNRAHAPFVICNCGALPDSLLDSLLFGHEKGAFTGAQTSSKGYFEQAQNGTLFLDEVAELSMAAQVRLLRVLEERTIRRVGAERVFPLNVRILAATNRNLADAVRQGTFREDLGYRLSHYKISIPPLRRRREDIPILAQYFCMASPAEMNIAGTFHLSPESIHNILIARWPGNVRQLKHTIECAMVDARLGGQSVLKIEASDLDMDLEERIPKSAAEAEMACNTQAEQAVAFWAEKTKETVPEPLGNPDQQVMWNALELSKGRISGPLGAAARLDIHPQTLRSRLFRLGYSPKAIRERYET